MGFSSTLKIACRTALNHFNTLENKQTDTAESFKSTSELPETTVTATATKIDAVITATHLTATNTESKASTLTETMLTLEPTMSAPSTSQQDVTKSSKTTSSIAESTITDPTTTKPTTTDPMTDSSIMVSDSSTTKLQQTTEFQLSVSTTNKNEETTKTSTSQTSYIVTSDFTNTEDCILDAASNQCVIRGTTRKCVPCDSVRCTMQNEQCINYENCTADCQCLDGYYRAPNTKYCLDKCSDHKCQNGGTCVPDPESDNYMCQCPNDYDGQWCHIVHNYCEEMSPAKCPAEYYMCQMLGPGNYTCDCIDGYVKISENGTDRCIKGDQTLKISISFKGLVYNDAYNNFSTPEFQQISTVITKTMKDLWPTEFLYITFVNFTNGSLIANFDVALKMTKDQQLDYSYNKFNQYLSQCNRQKNCFNQPYAVESLDFKAQDNRCDQIHCPENTECVVSQNIGDLLKCSCKSGFGSNQTFINQYNQIIEICEDINECLNNAICSGDDETCVNEIGSYKCLKDPCSKNPCPGHSTCENIEFRAYKCSCSWIYSNPSCGFPWIILLLVLSCVFLATTVILAASCIANRLCLRSSSGDSSDSVSDEVNLPISIPHAVYRGPLEQP